MTRKCKLSAFFLLLFITCFQASIAQKGSGPERPKLVIGIAVDQMRWDYFYRYYDRYGEGGWKRMLNEGFSCDNTFINHLPSYTGVGHATLFTGSVPALHGIVGNNWIDQRTGKSWYCTEDTTVQSVGTTSKNGQMSPQHLLVTTIGDELRLATNFQSKVVGVSLKDRASILPAGHAANGAFWFDDATGNFVTSSYYMQELPKWADDFNKADYGKKLLAGDWHTMYPISTYTQSTADHVAWEGTAKGQKAPVFPHKVSEYYKQDKGELRTTPMGNTYTLRFAKAAIEGYGLGSGSVTDMLTINLASTDYVGHRFGPNSIEVEDTYLRLDKDMEEFFNYLDNRFGKGSYTVFLSADHGAAHAINFMKQHKLPADFFNGRAIMDSVKNYLKKHYGDETLVQNDLNFHVKVNKEQIRKLKLDYEWVKRDVVQYLQTLPGVQFAVDVENLGSSPIPEPIKTMISNGYYPKRAGALMIIPYSGWFSSGGKGTTHGSWNPYDTRIPLVFMGWGIKHGSSSKTYHMEDIAPTIAALLKIQMGSGNTGKVITEVVP